MDLVSHDNTTTTKVIADAFGKTHRDVTRAVKLMECSENFRGANFAHSSYTTKQNKTMKCHKVTKDGFMFLAMGFTGKRAAKWKENFIVAFNEISNHGHKYHKLLIEANQAMDDYKKQGLLFSKLGHDLRKQKPLIIKSLESAEKLCQLELLFEE